MDSCYSSYNLMSGKLLKCAESDSFFFEKCAVLISEHNAYAMKW